MAGMKMTLEEVETLARNALIGAGANEVNASAVARSTWAAERDGVRSHGLMYVPIYAEHVQCGKVDGQAVPTVVQTKPAAVRVNAHSGLRILLSMLGSIHSLQPPGIKVSA